MAAADDNVEAGMVSMEMTDFGHKAAVAEAVNLLETHLINTHTR